MRAKPAWSASTVDPDNCADDGLSVDGIGGAASVGLFCST